MILNALVDYYDCRCSDPDPRRHLPRFGLEDKEIPFVIELTPDGRVCQLCVERDRDGKKLRTRRFLVPQGAKKTSGIKANLLWDTAAYVIGLDRERKSKAETTPAQAFRERIEALPDEAKQDAGVRAVLAALDRADWSLLQQNEAWPEIAEKNPLMTFRLAGDVDLVCQRPAVIAAVEAAPQDDDVVMGTCLVEGKPQPIARLHPAIKGVWGAQSSGANIVSFNVRSFESYGKSERQGENAPVGQRAAFAYTTALNHLLRDDSRNRLQVGDASTVYWAARSSRFDTFLSDVFDPDEGVESVRALLQACQTGRVPVDEGDIEFYVLSLAPSAARLSVRLFVCESLSKLAPRILQYLDDVRIVRRYDREPPTPSFTALLCSVALLGKRDNVPPRLGGDWMQSILEGRPYPVSLLNAAVIRCKAEQDVTYLRAAVIKAWLNRDRRRQYPDLPPHHQYFKESLDMAQENVPYRLGRLFAVLERIQAEAINNVNASIRDRFYGAACTTPGTVFPTLMRLKNAHISKLSPGRQISLERLIGQIVEPGEAAPAMVEFPSHLNLADQGRFALGYYHQRQQFFTRKEDAAANENDPHTHKEN